MPPLQPPEIGNVTTTQDYDSFCGEGSICEKFLFEMLKQWYLVLTAFVLILYLIILCPCVRKCIWNSKCCCGLVWFFESTAVNDCFKASPLKCFYIVTREMIDTTEFKNGFKNIICSFPNILKRGKVIVVKESMYENTPELIKTSFKDLSGKNKTENREDSLADEHGSSSDRGGDDESNYLLRLIESLAPQTTSFTIPQPKLTDKFPVDLAEDSKSLTAIIGEPGSGKSVYMETLRSFYIKKQGLYSFLIQFRGLKNDEKEMTFPEFLFAYRGFSCSKDLFEDKKHFGNWIKNHKSKIIILLDGLDEYHSDIDEGVPLLDMNNSATVNQWISLIFKQDQNSFMSGIKVVFTSRPSTILGLSGACRPSVYYKIKGLTSDLSLKSVITCYNSENSDEIFKFVKNSGPNIREFANNPFILALISLLYEETDENKITSETTIPQLYDCAFKQLRRSSHRRGEWNDDQEKIVDGFWYKMFEENKLQFTEADFDIHITRCNKARKENGQDEVSVTLASLETFSMIQIQSKFSTDKVEAKDKVIEPKHRTIQEFHVARHMVRSLELEKFETQVAEMFQKPYDDKWKMIRGFLTYFINNIKGGEEILEKKNFFINFLCQHIRQIFEQFVPYGVMKHQMQIMENFLDFRDEGIIHEVHEKLKGFYFYFSPFDLSYDVAPQGFYHFLHHFVARAVVNIRDWDYFEVRNFFQEFQQDYFKNEDMVIMMYAKQDQCMKELVETFPHFTRKFRLELDGKFDDDLQFCRKLMEEIINFDTSKLQTQELKVEVVHWGSILLDVVIRRGKPRQFIKVNMSGYNDDQIRDFFQIIKLSSKPIEDMEIEMDAKQDQYINEFVAIFPHFTRKLKLFREDKDADVQLQFCRRLKEEINNFDTSKLQTQELKVEVVGYNKFGDITILLEVVIHSGEPPQFIKVDIIGGTNDEVREFFQTIQRSTTTIEDMLIVMTPRNVDPNELVETFPHFTRKLKLVLHGGYDGKQFSRKLAEEIINFDTSKLQTQELKVEVVDWRLSTIFLEVIIRRGEPLQFTKVDIYEWNDEQVQDIFQIIKRSSTPIEDMEIEMEPDKVDPKELVGIFPHFTRKLKLQLNGDYDDDRQFCRKLKEEIINFDTSKLQTQGLKVEVVCEEIDSSLTLTPVILLEVVIRRVGPLQYINDHFN